MVVDLLPGINLFSVTSRVIVPGFLAFIVLELLTVFLLLSLCIIGGLLRLLVFVMVFSVTSALLALSVF